MARNNSRREFLCAAALAAGGAPMESWRGAQSKRDGDASSARSAPEWLPRVKLNGRLAPRYEGNAQYLLDMHEKRRSFMIDAYRLREHRKKEADWDGEYAGKWLDAAARMAANSGHAALREKALSLRGPEVFAVDNRDNPKVDLDKIAIPAEVRLIAASPEGSRRRYVGEIRYDGRTADVTFTPYADAGDGSRYRTAFPRLP